MFAQQGFFLWKLFAETPNFDQILTSMMVHPELPSQPVIRKLRVSASRRVNILEHLRGMNIHRASLFPGLDVSAKGSKSICKLGSSVRGSLQVGSEARLYMLRHGRLRQPIHPGEILRAEFMEPLQLSMNRLALDLRVPVTRVADIVHERRGITPDTALRLARYFNTSAGFWMNLQTAYDLEVAEDKLLRTIEREVRPAIMAATNSPS